ncbi:hypothetical protein SASPL_147681 [Salvia splendens]|uniref:Uncharacterized protein n=1 Tax=Salvia splendens TaxID=180675 RepID=A0A8X8WF12_SALSN|nr:hypothetical protein SASPL_147681 [Salvia splendens]
MSKICKRKTTGEREPISGGCQFSSGEKIIAWRSSPSSLMSVGCFVSHYRWESVAAGVSVVAMAQAMDQVTNAKLVEDSWRCGVRAMKGEIVEADEIGRLLAREAVDDGGSSQVNLKMFTEHKKFDVWLG